MDASALILAAGKGTRMRSPLPKPLVPFQGKPIVAHLIDAFREAEVEDVTLIIGHGGEQVIDTFKHTVEYVIQETQNGTAHAVSQAKNIKDWKGKDVFVFVGDSPLVSATSIRALYDKHKRTKAACTFLTATFEIELPYGRILRNEQGEFAGCVEELDATNEQLKIQELLSSHFIFNADILFSYLEEIKPHPKNGEYYLTDILDLLLKNRLKVETQVVNDYRELVGLNTPEDIAWAEQVKQLHV